jgi:hypothetical protein
MSTKGRTPGKEYKAKEPETTTEKGHDATISKKPGFPVYLISAGVEGACRNASPLELVTLRTQLEDGIAICDQHLASQMIAQVKTITDHFQPRRQT